ncbi:MAG: UDP-N-acetylglucosamine 2-epimerase, partial [Patescibacteria group bacterium]
MKLVFIAGARPNFMKVAALIEACKKHNEAAAGEKISYTLVHTGQHYDTEMSKVFFDELGLPKPDYNLGVGGKDAEEQREEIIAKLIPIFTELKPDIVVVVGDVTSTLAGAIAAKKLGIPIAHIEAGLRSFNDKMPEEYNRRETDKISDYLFVTERAADENLRKEGVKGKPFFVGNVMIDTLRRFLPVAEQTPLPAGLSPKHYAVVTLHRAENVDSVVLGSAVKIIRRLGSDVPVIFPIHPRTRAR